MTRPALPGALPSGFNVIGHITGNLGLGVAARNTLRALDQSNRPFDAVDVDPLGGRGGHDPTYARHIHTPPQAGFGINLFQLNPPEVACLAQESPAWLHLEDRLNACVPFWELPRLPVKWGWVPILETVDVVLAPSRFILDAVEASAPRATVWHYPQAVFLPDGVVADRAAFGLPADSVLFYLSLDVTSDVSRKNPFAALDAFTRAFGADEDAHLVVKLNSSSSFPWAREAADRARASLEAHPNVIVVDRAMGYVEALSLSASCDVYVSLHRAEGLGLNLLEAMSLGKPVIATGWSGSMDFTTNENACLVGYDLIPVAAEHAAYQPSAIGRGQRWADPSVEEAAQWMRRLASDASLRQAIGARARSDTDASRERFVRGAIFDRLVEAAPATLAAETPRERRSRWTRIRRAALPLRIRRMGGRALRSLGLRR